MKRWLREARGQKTMRVYAIARELGVASAEVLAVVGAASDDGASPLTATSGLTEAQVAAVRAAYGQAGLAPETSPAGAQETSPAAGGAGDPGGEVTPAAGSTVADEDMRARGYAFVGGSLRVGRVTYRSGDLVPMEALPTLPLHVRRKLVLHRG